MKRRPTSEDRDMAAQWVARMDSGHWQHADETALQEWLSADPSRQGLLLQTHATWLMADQLAADQVEAEPATTTGQSALWRRRGVLGGLAAAGAAVAVAARFAVLRGVDYVTQLGEIRRVPLDDGSVMTINSDTQLKVTLGKNLRQIELAQGEAWFEVAKDSARPFVVASGQVRAEAVGTAFSVRKREAGVEVLVTEGIVETWSDADAGQRLRVVAGERALVSERALVHYEAGESASVDRALAWRNGMIDLNGMSLRDAAEEFNRYNQRQIVIANPDVAGEQFDGLFSVSDPEGFAKAVQATLNVTVDSSDPRVIRIESEKK